MAEPIKDLSGEIWKSVVGYECTYEVSNMGRVRRMPGYAIVHNRYGGEHRYTVRGRTLRPTPNPRSGRRYVHLKGSPARNMAVSVIVLTAFVGPRPEGMECCHNDGDVQNDKLSNLRWDTHVANVADMAIHGTARRGEAHCRAKLASADIPVIRHRLQRGDTQTAIALDYGVSRRAIGLIKTGQNWAHIA